MEIKGQKYKEFFIFQKTQVTYKYVYKYTKQKLILGYKDTARMLVEAGLSLSLNSKEI
jgi:hypothetical protein